MRMKDVKFLPWVGRNYEAGRNGKRIMVLGESHYCSSPADATPSITNRVIADLLDPQSEHEGYKNTYTKFANALAGKPLTWDEKITLWHSLLFYNYVQVPLPSPRIAPTPQDFALSEAAFFEVLNTYRPDAVLVWGSRLYNNLPRRGRQLPDLQLPDGSAIETWAYETASGHVVQLLPITHPSAAFVPAYWHGAIEAFLGRTI